MANRQTATKCHASTTLFCEKATQKKKTSENFH